MKKYKIIIIGVSIALIIIGFAYYNSYQNGNISKDTTLSDTLNPIDNADKVEDKENVTPMITPITSTPNDTNSEEQLSTNRYVATQIIKGEKLYGYINEYGEFIIQPQYSYASDFNEEVATVAKDGKYYLIDVEGNILFTSESILGDLTNGAARFGQIVSDVILYGYIDNSGKVIIEPKYTIAHDFNEELQTYVKLVDDKYALINIKGEILNTYEINSKYSYIYQYQDGYVVYNSSGKYGVDTMNGDVIFEPIYSAIEYLGNDLFAMKNPKLEFFEVSNMTPSALFNPKGEQLTDYDLYDITHYKEGYASVTDSTSTYFIGLDGKEITTIERFLGRGTLIILGDVIKADIDQSLSYTKMDGKVIYQTDNMIDLGTGIVVKEEKFKPNKYVLVRYPQIEGLKDSNIEDQVNNQLETIFTQYRMELKEEDGLTVEDSFHVYQRKNLIIIKMTGYDYSFGAAHGMPLEEYYYIDVNSGKFYQLEDIFKQGIDYQLIINEIITEKINKEIDEQGDALYYSDAFTGIEAAHDFILTDDSIIIYFYPYVLASYAQGFIKFEIPFVDIHDLIDSDGEFYKAFN